MCGRYSFIPDKDFYDRYEVVNRLPYLPYKYNVATAIDMPVIISLSPNQAVFMRWGLIP